MNKVVKCALIGAMSLLIAACSSQKDNAAKKTASKGWEPKQDIEFVIPFGAGGGNDVMVRKIIEIIKKNNLCSVNIVPVNKKGGSGVVGYTYLHSKGKGNEYTLASTSASFYTQPLVGHSRFSPTEKDFSFVAHMVKDPVVIAANPELGFKDMKDLVEYAKKNPGTLKWGGVGTVSDDAIIMYMLNDAAKIQLTYVPYDDGGLLHTAVVGGHVALNVPSVAEGKELIDVGKLVALAACSDKRFESMPNVPTTFEQGYNVNHSQSRGIVMNPGVKPEVLEYYSNLFKKVSETPEWEDFVKKNSMEAAFMDYKTYAKFSKEMYADYDKYLKLINRK